MKTPSILLAVAVLVTQLQAASLPESAKIDQLLAQDWNKHGLQANPPASDEIIVRRLYLDIAGRIPTVEETESFLRSNDPQKRAKLIDQLLASDGFTSHMFNYWADVLRLTDNVKGRLTAEAYEEWMKKQLKANTPYDQMVRSLLTTEGGAWDSGSIGFWMRDENKLDHLAYTVQVFLGTSIVCAQCHDHPFDKWTQMDYYGMAAFTYGMNTRGGGNDYLKFKKPGGELDREAMKTMSKQERKEYAKKMRSQQEAQPKVDKQQLAEVRQVMGDVMKPLRYTNIDWNEGKLPALPHDYKYSNGKPGQQIQPKVMFGHEAPPVGGETTLAAFARWMTSPENPRFTTVIANRMWKKVFGLGLIEPVDEMTDSTVASNPALMEYLTQLMIEKKYSLKSFLRVLFNTKAYQSMAGTQEVAVGETYRFTGPLLRRMSAEQVWDSLVTLTAGNVDAAVDADNERLHQYLDDLAFFLNTVRDKGVEGLIEVSKEASAKLAANQKQLAAMREQLAAKKEAGGASLADSKQLAQQAAKLRREAGQDILVALLGEERASDLRRGYNNKQPDSKKRSLQIDRAKLADMTKEQRKEYLKTMQQSMQGVQGLSTRASELPSPAKAGHLLRTFGQSDREVIENASKDASVPQALTLLNGPIVQAVTSPVSNLSLHLDKAGTSEQKLDLLYTALLSRKPTGSERSILSSVMHERGSKALEDVTHALLTGSQFLFIQ